MSTKKALNEVIRRAEKQGWTVKQRRRSGHLVFRSPEGRAYFTGGSPSDYRATVQLEQDLSRMGYERAPKAPKKKG